MARAAARARSRRRWPGAHRARRQSSSASNASNTPSTCSGSGCATMPTTRGVRLFGDLPFYVGPSSVETWAHRELFQLEARRRAGAGRRRAAGLLLRARAAVGQSGIRLARAGAQRIFLVADARARAARAPGPVAPRPFPRAGGLLGRAGGRRRCARRQVAAHARRGAAAAGARGVPRHAAGGRGPRRHHRGRARTQDGFALPGMRVLQFGFDGEPGNAHAAARAYAR